MPHISDLSHLFCQARVANGHGALHAAATRFSLRWQMQRCAPMGRESVDLSGGVALVVSHAPFGLSAMVVPDRLRVDSHLGRRWLRGPFTAEAVLFAHGRYGEGVAPGRPLEE